MEGKKSFQSGARGSFQQSSGGSTTPFSLKSITSVKVLEHSRAPFVSQGFIKAKKYPSNTRVEVMSEGGESAMFKQLFQCWRDRSPTGVGSAYNVGKLGDSDPSFIRKTALWRFSSVKNIKIAIFVPKYRFSHAKHVFHFRKSRPVQV